MTYMKFGYVIVIKKGDQQPSEKENTKY